MKLRPLIATALLAFVSVAPVFALTEQGAPADENAPRPHHPKGKDQVTVFENNYVGPEQVVLGDAVAVIGNTKVEGIVEGDAVAVLGDTEINGEVHGSVVAVLGDLTLGPNARVNGDAVCVGGHLFRAPGSFLQGDVVAQSIGSHIHILGPARQVWLHGFRHPWVWLANLGILALYAVVAGLFPGGIRRCGDTLTHRPGAVLLASVLTVLGLPILAILLVVTLIGIPVAIFVLPAGFVFLWMFGKASFYALVGRAVSSERLPLWLAVVVGGLICLVFFLVPFVGLLLSLAISTVMIGAVVTVLFDSIKSQPSAQPPSLPSSAPPLGGAATPEVFPASASQGPPIMTAPAATLATAGFWIRAAALAIDGLIIGVVTTALHGHGRDSSAFLVVLAAYGAILWKVRGSTIGGIVFGLKVVRMDDRPLDWPTAIVRALACFLSLIALGLGFIWVVFDPRHQSWHDKIAGTVVVRPLRGPTLV